MKTEKDDAAAHRAAREAANAAVDVYLAHDAGDCAAAYAAFCAAYYAARDAACDAKKGEQK